MQSEKIHFGSSLQHYAYYAQWETLKSEKCCNAVMQYTLWNIERWSHESVADGWEPNPGSPFRLKGPHIIKIAITIALIVIITIIIIIIITIILMSLSTSSTSSPSPSSSSSLSTSSSSPSSSWTAGLRYQFPEGQKRNRGISHTRT